MDKMNRGKIVNKQKTILHENGKFFFSRDTERRIFFFLTVFMLLLGIFVKLDLF